MTANYPSRVAIVGAGAIGGLFAARLIEAGIPTVLVARNPSAADWVNKQGITIVENSTVKWVKVPTLSREQFVEAPDILIMAVKTFDLGSTFAELVNIADRARQIVCVQSSIRLAQCVPSEFHKKTLATALMVGASGTAGGLIFSTSQSRIYIGGLIHAVSAEQINLATAVFDRIADVKVSNPILPALIAKVAFNVACFPFSVAGRCSFGTAFANNQKAVRIAGAVLKDCALLAVAANLQNNLKFGPIEASAIARSQERAEEAVLWLANLYSQVIPSSVFDHMRRRKSELPSYFDEFIELGTKVHVPPVALVALRDRFSEMLARDIPLGPAGLEWLSQGHD